MGTETEEGILLQYFLEWNKVSNANQANFFDDEIIEFSNFCVARSLRGGRRLLCRHISYTHFCFIAWNISRFRFSKWVLRFFYCFAGGETFVIYFWAGIAMKVTLCNRLKSQISWAWDYPKTRISSSWENTPTLLLIQAFFKLTLGGCIQRTRNRSKNCGYHLFFAFVGHFMQLIVHIHWNLLLNITYSHLSKAERKYEACSKSIAIVVWGL